MAIALRAFVHPVFMIVLFAVYAILIGIDLFKRGLLSDPVVYAATMLLAPASVMTAVCTFICFIGSIYVTVLIFVPALLLVVLAAVVYIRGHIKPIDKNKCMGNTTYAAAKRLIWVGTAGTVIYGILTIAQIIEFAVVFNSIGGSPIESIAVLIILVILLFVPLVNIFAWIFVPFIIIFFMFLGAELAAIGAAAMMMLLMSLLVTNGCIRYIVTVNTTKAKKFLYISVCFIPIVNIFTGIKYIKQME